MLFLIFTSDAQALFLTVFLVPFPHTFYSKYLLLSPGRACWPNILWNFNVPCLGTICTVIGVLVMITLPQEDSYCSILVVALSNNSIIPMGAAYFWACSRHAPYFGTSNYVPVSILAMVLQMMLVSPALFLLRAFGLFLAVCAFQTHWWVYILVQINDPLFWNSSSSRWLLV